jgi:hypothetical protein
MASQMLKQLYRKQDGEPPMVLIDLGYVNDQAARDRADRLLAAGIGKRNLSLEGFNRLFIRIPPSKVAAILAAFPEIKKGTSYWQSTHNWLDQPQKENPLET